MRKPLLFGTSITRLGRRQDLIVIAEGLLQFDWYSQTLQHTYSDLVIPDFKDFTTPLVIANANPTHPACFANYQGGMS